TRLKLETWMAEANELDIDVAARECYLLGHEAIRQLVFDPLLPAPLVDVNERHAFTETVQVYDRVGHAIWRKLLAEFSAGPNRSGALRQAATDATDATDA